MLGFFLDIVSDLGNLHWKDKEFYFRYVF